MKILFMLSLILITSVFAGEKSASRKNQDCCQHCNKTSPAEIGCNQQRTVNVKVLKPDKQVKSTKSITEGQ